MVTLCLLQVQALSLLDIFACYKTVFPAPLSLEPVAAAEDHSLNAAGSTRYTRSRSETPSSPNGISASAFSPGYFSRFFVVERELGRGGKGVVLLVTHVLDKVPLGQYACKRVPVGNDHVWLTNVLSEVRLLEHLSHQHLVYYKHVWLEDVKISNFGPSVPCAFILQQYCNAGDLHQYIIHPAQADESAQALKERLRRRSRDSGRRPSELQGRKLRFEEIYSFFKDISSGLNHLHVNGFIHRDLKPSNCLLHDSGKGLRVLVSDFGEVQIENMVRKSSGATGTVSYCAPEVLRRDATTGSLGNFTTKSDIFSLGMILYFLCFARLPYKNADSINEDNEDLDLLREEIVSWTGLHEERKLRPDLPEQLYTFLRRLLSLQPEDRPSAEDILLGIKTGSGLDQISDARPNKAAHMFDDLSASSRISPVDSPRSATPMTRKLSSSSAFSRPTATATPSKIRLSNLHREHSSGGSRSPPSVPRTPTNIHYNKEDSPASSPSDSLILRPPFPSPTKRSHDAYTLDEPAPQQSRTRAWLLTHNPSLRRSTKLIIFTSKVLSLNIACSPMATHPPVLYSVLGLATLDFFHQDDGNERIGGVGGIGRGGLISAVLIGMHIAILLSLRGKEMLCIREKEPYWAEGVV
ncbi:uncharacterized protein KY384_001992 [Bacidia gigantensis]|uniref:uncharacterized protein n=1 Tax=Bacidia gigantensis TaxID=2732470 RepID=UPI001D04C74E|nr:uncharacterized protein KY384_001992 [Bacidia gigantensis]KAG8533209.1 hypothetical protein KY384_001992 [Bacidia gigantensis]